MSRLPARVPRRWSLRSGDPDAEETLGRELGLSPLLARVLCARQITAPAQAERFLRPRTSDLPDPLRLNGMEAAVGRLVEAARRREKVVVAGDYDVDGTSASALLLQYFQASGMHAAVRLPTRDEGYGLKPEGVEAIAQAGGRVIVTVDCGISNLEAAHRARELGVDLLVTDHHEPGDALPCARAIVNPKLSPDYPDPAIAGVGVAWSLAAALERALADAGMAHGGATMDLAGLTELAAVGTVADVVSLRGPVNRVLVTEGLARLNAQPRPGLAALRDVAQIRGRVRAGHIGFQIGPRLNAAGRMEGPQDAFLALSTGDLAEAAALAARLDTLNHRRQKEEQEILDQAVEMIEASGGVAGRSSLVVARDGWHHGIIGIVASRLVEIYHRPTVVLAVHNGSAKGSARSIPALDLYGALKGCGDVFVAFGGHKAAAGMTVQTDRIEDLRTRFEDSVKRRLGPADLVPRLSIDADGTFGDVTLESVRELERLEPFGMGNPAPVLQTLGVTVRERRTMGAENQHVRFELEQAGVRLKAVAWRGAQTFAALVPGTRVDIAYSASVNLWQGREAVQLDLIDAAPERDLPF